MGAFTFIAQPLFGVAIASYGWKVLKELRAKRVLRRTPASRRLMGHSLELGGRRPREIAAVKPRLG